MKLGRLFILALVLVISIAACNSQQGDEKLLNSEDFPYTRAIINTYDDSAFDISIVSWEFVSNDMIRILGERKSEIGDKVHIANYDFLVDKTNVTFLTIEQNTFNGYVEK